VHKDLERERDPNGRRIIVQFDVRDLEKENKITYLEEGVGV